MICTICGTVKDNPLSPFCQSCEDDLMKEYDTKQNTKQNTRDQ